MSLPALSPDLARRSFDAIVAAEAAAAAEPSWRLTARRAFADVAATRRVFLARDVAPLYATLDLVARHCADARLAAGRGAGTPTWR